MKFITKTKNRLRLAWQWIAGQAIMIWHWIKNLCFVFLTTKSQVRIFEGYMHWWFSRIYADRRTKISRINKYCGGKMHYVLPAGDYALVVINSSEIQFLKKKGWYKGWNIKDILEHAYYVSQNKTSIKK